MKDFGCFNLVSWNLSQGHLSDVPRQQCYAKAPSHTRPQVLGTVWKKWIFDDSKRVFNRFFILGTKIGDQRIDVGCLKGVDGNANKQGKNGDENEF